MRFQIVLYIIFIIGLTKDSRLLPACLPFGSSLTCNKPTTPLRVYIKTRVRGDDAHHESALSYVYVTIQCNVRRKMDCHTSSSWSSGTKHFTIAFCKMTWSTHSSLTHITMIQKFVLQRKWRRISIRMLGEVKGPQMNMKTGYARYVNSAMLLHRELIMHSATVITRFWPIWK